MDCADDFNREAISQEDITRFMFQGLHDDYATGDCIFVFGSVGTSVERITEAVRLYQTGRAPKILISGGDRWGKHQDTDAERMKKLALQMGVNEQDIIVEELSNHTKENVLSSMLVLDRVLGLHRISRLLIVTAPWHMRRCQLTLQTYMPRWIQYSWCPAQTPGQTEYDWTTTMKGIELVYGEFDKIRELVADGQILMDAMLPMWLQIAHGDKKIRQRLSAADKRGHSVRIQH